MIQRLVSRILVIVVVFGGLFNAAINQTRAIDTTRQTFYNNGTYHAIIGDSDFIDKDSMSTGDIQGFLEGKGSYLAQYNQNGRSAAQIIYDAAHGAGEASGKLQDIDITSSTGTVSPKVLLVTLNKEQSLISLTADDRNNDVNSYNNRLDRAMGYGCPDSGGCSDRYKGFTNQVEWAAWQLRYNFEAAGKNQSWWNQYYSAIDSQTCKRQFYVGNVCSVSNSKPESWIPDTTTVTLSNKATSALYRYTPHVFNGNYNFWKFMNTWFSPGSANITVAAVASNDTAEVSAKTYKETFKISGSKANLDNVYYNGNRIGSPSSVTWDTTITPTAGTHDYTIEYRNGDNQVIATKKVTIERHNLGDINGDGTVDLQDLSVLGESFGVGVSDGDWRNLNPETDNEVNILDLSLFAEKWS